MKKVRFLVRKLTVITNEMPSIYPSPMYVEGLMDGNVNMIYDLNLSFYEREIAGAEYVGEMMLKIKSFGSMKCHAQILS